MQITLLAFAQAREYFGFDEKILTVTDGITAADVLDELKSDLRTHLPNTRAAVDLEFVEWNQPLREGQTLAIIPPVSGG